MVFPFIGLALIAYAGFAASTGTVYAKNGPFLDTIRRDQRPGYFWTVVGIYVALGVVIIAFF